MPHYDVIVIGSGFGGAVSALRLTEKGYSVGVLEAGRRFRPGDFAKTNWDMGKYFWFPRVGMRGILRMDLLSDVLVLSGAGVGGGSLGYANTLYEPGPDFYDDPQWAGLADWGTELAPFYALAKRMLGVAQSPADTPADDVIRFVADRLGAGDSFQPAPVGVFMGDPAKEVDDPYFGGAGPRRVGCAFRGACMVGCNQGAKNTLDKNYLHLAEANGAVIHPSAEVVDVTESDGGWDVTAVRPGPVRRGRRRFTADQVVFSAGALGTVRLLLALAERGRLPHMSPEVGRLVRTNSEVLLGATARGLDIDYSQGHAITSSIRPEPRTQIEPVRYPKGSSAMGLLSTILVDGGPGPPRAVRYLAKAIRHPIDWARSLSVRRWAERTVILLVMQSYDNSLQLSREKGLLGTRLRSRRGRRDPIPSYIPIANEAGRLAAEAMGGDARNAVNEVLLNRPATAHILGGAHIGADPGSGVIDAYHRMFGHRGLHVVDGAAVGANLGTNPSLTITAMAERAMSMWPDKGGADPRPALGDPYRAVPPVAPLRRSVRPDIVGLGAEGGGRGA